MRKFVLMLEVLLVVDYTMFFGRFHPLIVHLPIGFLLLAVVLEFWPGERPKKAIGVAWALGAASAVAAAGAGWLLAADGGYGGPTLFWHRWGGVAVAVLSIGGFFVLSRGGWLAKGYGLVTLAALTLTGHQGGNLTHGEDYLFQYAPPVVQKIAGHTVDTSGTIDWTEVNPDSVLLFADLLHPVINDKCVRCHNSEKQNGGLRMDSVHYLLEGGDTGPLFVAGNAVKSLWHERVTLPTRNVKAMPPQGERLTHTEVRLLEYWLDSGADTDQHFVTDEVPEDLKLLLLRDYDLDLSPRLYVEQIRAEPLDDKTLDGLRGLNWTLTELVPGGAALEAKPTPGRTVDAEALKELAAAAPEQIAWLSLDNQDLDDDALAVLPGFVNLNRLRLNGTEVGAATLSRLAELEHLESLNLYNTKVTDAALAELDNYPALQRVYLWQSSVSTDAAAAFAERHPRIAVDTGFTLMPAPASAPENTLK